MLENIRQILSDIIISNRKRLGLSQAKLAEATGLSIKMIQQIEYMTSWPSPETLEKIAPALGLTPIQLFGKAEGKSRSGLVEVLQEQEKEIAALKQEIAQMKSSALMAAYEKATPRVRALTIQFLADMTRIEAEDAARLLKESALNSLDSKNKKVSGR